MGYSGVPGIYHGTDSLGGYQVDTVLTKMAFNTPQPPSVLRAFVDVRQNLGKNAGDLVYRNRWGNLAAGGAIAESATSASTDTMVLTQATATCTEFMNSVSIASKLIDLANMDVMDPIMVGLRDNERKVIDAYLYSNVYNAALYRYVGSAADSYALTSNGTATATCASAMNEYHVRQMVYTLKSMNAPVNPATGNYTGVCSLKAADNLRADSLWKNVQLYANLAGITKGYLGSFQGVDWFEENSAMGGSGVITFTNYSGSGKAFIFGAGYATEDIVIEPQIRTNATIAASLGRASDFGRRIDVAWYELAAFGTLWNVAGQAHCVCWDSA